jgi:hypothetical protein
VVAAVVNLQGDPARTEDGGYPEVIKTLEEALAQAREGRVAAVGMFLVRPNRDIDVSVSKNDIGRHTMVAGTVYLQHDLAHDDPNVYTHSSTD